MTLTPSFWSTFEEPAVDAEVDANITKTSKREEPDQRLTELTSGTKTITEAREEDDQDPNHSGFHAIPPHLATGTKTQTRAREEPDQDEANGCFSEFTISSSAKTETATAQREERDQDNSSGGYATFPHEGQS